MRVLVIGCGSIGSRRAKILHDMGHEVHVADTKWEMGQGPPWVETTGTTERLRGVPKSTMGWPDWEVALFAIDEPFAAALICTPPHTHVALARQCIEAGIGAVYVEKPFSLSMEGVPELVELAEEAGTIGMGACNMRFDERVMWNWEAIGECEWATFSMRQAAKYWSPGHERLPMLLDSIHELDLTYALRGPMRLDPEYRVYSDLDYGMAYLRHDDGKRSTVWLNRFGDPPTRGIIIEDTLTPVDLWPPDPQMYHREMEHFMHCVESDEAPCCTFADAAHVLEAALSVCEVAV